MTQLLFAVLQHTSSWVHAGYFFYSCELKWSFTCFFVYFQGVEGKYLLVKPLKDKFSARSFTIDKTLGKSVLSYKIKHLGEI